MYLLLLDSEQAGIVRHALTAARGYFQGRVERVDPEELLSKSLRMMDIKTEHIERQLSRTASEHMTEMKKQVRQQLTSLAAQAGKARNEQERDAFAERLTLLAIHALTPDYEAPK